MVTTYRKGRGGPPALPAICKHSAALSGRADNRCNNNYYQQLGTPPVATTALFPLYEQIIQNPLHGRLHIKISVQCTTARRGQRLS